jgi:hypothetical protein
MGSKTQFILDYLTESTQSESFLEQVSDTHVLSQFTDVESFTEDSCSVVVLQE